jgi:hypothetical protein
MFRCNFSLISAASDYGHSMAHYLTLEPTNTPCLLFWGICFLLPVSYHTFKFGNCDFKGITRTSSSLTEDFIRLTCFATGLTVDSTRVTWDLR